MRRFSEAIIKRWHLTEPTKERAQSFIHNVTTYLYKQKDDIKIYFSNGDLEGKQSDLLWIFIVARGEYRYVKCSWAILNVSGNFIDRLINKEIEQLFNKCRLN